MSLTDQQLLSRFHAYAAAFEAAFASDDWSVLEPFFTADASNELNGGRVEGRSAVLQAFHDSVTMFDRRFDRRALRFVHGPVVEDGVVHLKAAVRYELGEIDEARRLITALFSARPMLRAQMARVWLVVALAGA